jgi:hypothetical protein
MPTKIALQRARQDARKGKKPATQAGEFVREEMHRLHEGDGNVRSRKQAIAIGLSEARRAGVKLGLPRKAPSPPQPAGTRCVTPPSQPAG